MRSIPLAVPRTRILASLNSYDLITGCENTSDSATLNVHGPCQADFDDSGAVGPFDLAVLLGAWGPNASHPADLNADGTVGPLDLALLLDFWGPCL